MKRLSIIVPGYNTPSWMWKRCVRSVVAAIGSCDEVICVDDGSNAPFDGCELSEFGECVKILRLDSNCGLPYARNAALDIAQGKYVTFVDSDDEIRPESFLRCIESLENYGSDIAVYGVKVIWVANELYKEDVLPGQYLGALSAESLVKVFRACLFDYACNKVYRRQFLDQNALRFNQKVRTGEDTVFNCSCVAARATWCLVDYVGYVYYRYDGTMLSRYVPNIRETHRLKLEARAACRAACPGADELLGGRVKISESALDRVEWMNMWKRQSPVSLRDRWRFLTTHPSVSARGRLGEFVCRLVYSILRQNFYVRPIRRWQVKRLFPNVKEWNGEKR